MNYHNIELASSFKYDENCTIIIEKVKELVEYTDSYQNKECHGGI